MRACVRIVTYVYDHFSLHARARDRIDSAAREASNGHAPCHQNAKGAAAGDGLRELRKPPAGK